VETETGRQPKARVRIRGPEGARECTSSGSGPVDSVYRAAGTASGIRPNLLRYEIQAVTEGTDAMGQVSVQIEA